MRKSNEHDHCRRRHGTHAEKWDGDRRWRRIYDCRKGGSPSRTALAATTAARAQLQARLAVVAQEDVNRIFEETGFDPEFYVEVRRRLEAKKQDQ